MGIVNAGQLAVYDALEPALRDAVEDVLFDRRSDATERLLGLAEQFRGAGTKREVDVRWREAPSRNATSTRSFTESSITLSWTSMKPWKNSRHRSS